jgi:hypothetical protein
VELSDMSKAKQFLKLSRCPKIIFEAFLKCWSFLKSGGIFLKKFWISKALWVSVQTNGLFLGESSGQGNSKSILRGRIDSVQ